MFWTKAQVIKSRSVIWNNDKERQQEAIYNIMSEAYVREEQKFYFKIHNIQV